MFGKVTARQTSYPLLLVFLVLSSLEPAAPTKYAIAGPTRWGWNLPLALSDTNTQIIFEVDSTWHLVKGRTSGISGNAWLADAKDELSVRARFDLPVGRFDTDGEMRDERLREVMDSEHSPVVRLHIDSFRPLCDITSFSARKPCQVELSSRLTIRTTERPIRLQGSLEHRGTEVVLTGDTRFSWADFGVEDPSILIAKLDPEVVVRYSVTIPTIRRE